MKKIFFLLVSVVSFTSCYKDEFFELKNPPEFPWQTVKEFEMAVVAPYHKYFFGGWGGSYMTDRVIFDGMTDILYLIPGVAEDFPHDEIYYRNTTVRNSRADQCFTDAFLAINNLNSAMDFFYHPARYFSDPSQHPFYDLSASQLNEIHRQIGEMHLFRAFCYFQNIIRHCSSPGTSGYSEQKKLPFRKEWTFNPDSMRHPELASAKQILDEIIIPDLRIARTWLPKYYTAANHPSYQYGRPAKYAAYALSARIFFYMGNENGYTTTSGESFNPWDSALIYAEAVINSGLYNLNEEPIKAFNRSSASLASEVIWEVIHYNTEYKDSPWDATLFTWNHGNVLNSNPDYTPAFPYGSVPATKITDSLWVKETAEHRCTWHVYCMSNATAKYIGWKDSDTTFSIDASGDKRFRQLYLWVYRAPRTEDEVINASALNLYNNKFPWVTLPQIWCHKYFRGSSAELTNVPLIRLPEMYLTAAIIENIKKINDKGLYKINVVRNRAGLNPLGTITEEDIHKERIKELAFEGDRLIYLYGLRKSIGPGDRLDQSEIPLGDARLQWQLPLNETQFYE